jgi:peptidoglycan L-alanyl-D-glutamate endopeptidase CwlK
VPQFSQTSLDRLATCDPRLQRLARLAILIVDFQVLEGHRDQAAQEQAVADGKSKLHWPNGNHNKLPSKAMDIAPLSTDVSKGKLDWGDLIAFGRLMGIMQALAFEDGIKLRFGLDWDGDFRSVGRDADESFLDAPHVEVLG